MNRIRLLAIGSVLMFALTVVAQQTGGPANSGVPTAEEQLKLLSPRLELTSDQRAKFKSILDELHDATLKLVQDESLSHDERMTKVRPLRYKADKEMREILTDDQKKKLDQVEQEPHPGLHGSLNGATPPPAKAPKN